MAVYTHILKNTNKETIIKVDAVGNDNTTVALTDLTSDDQVLIGGGTPAVNIVKAIFTGELGSAIRITRDGENILACAPENAPTLDLNSNGITDNRNNTEDIVIIKEGTDNVPVTGYLVLRKVDGWQSKIEYEKYGAYDDETSVGPQNISGAPAPVGLYDLPTPGSGSYETAQSLTMTSVGTPYTPGSSLTSLANAAAGLWRKKFVGNFGTTPGSGNDVTFCRTHPSFFGQADTYVGFGNQDLSTENYYTLEWVGYFKAPSTGTFNFWTNVDDDVYFWIGTNALDGNNTSSNTHLSESNDTHSKNANSVNLTAGHYYPVRIQFTEYAGSENMQILWGKTTDTTAHAGSDVAGVWVYNSSTKGF